MSFMETETARRPLKVRDTAWARELAVVLVRLKISPNAISISSAVFAAMAAIALYSLPKFQDGHRILLLIVAIAGMQMRLLCNLLDGMVAIEGGTKTKSGEVFNDLPDRIADSMIFIGTGYAAQSHPFGRELGFIAAILSIFTAYVRLLGGAARLKQSFIGPMAKQQRMALLTLACALSLAEPMVLPSGTILCSALIVINLGCVITVWRRTAKIVYEMEAR